MMYFAFCIPALLQLLQLVSPSYIVQPLSSLSVSSIIADVALGKIDLTKLGGLYINNAERGIDLLSAFLTKHLLDYNLDKFKQELESIHKLEILSCVLFKELSDIKGERATISLFDQLYSAGLFTTIAHSDDQVISRIKHNVIIILERHFTFRGSDLVVNFIIGLFKLMEFDRLEELCPVLLRLIKLEEYDETLGNEIIMSHENFEEELRYWVQFLGITIDESISFSQKPLKVIRRLIEVQIEASKRFSFDSSEELYKVIKWPTERFLIFLSDYERAMVVIAIMIIRAKFGLKIDGGESSDLKSQLSKISTYNNFYLGLILESKTGLYEEEVFLDILKSGKIFDNENIGSFNPIHFAIMNIYNLIKYALFHVEEGDDLMQSFSRSRLGFFPFARHLIFENDPEISVERFLGLTKFNEVEKTFKFVFDRYFESITQKGTKVKGLKTVSLVLQAACHTSESRAQQLIKIIDFDSEDSTSSVLYHYVDRLPMKIQRMAIEEINLAYERRGIVGINVETLIKLVPEPIIQIKCEKVSGRLFRYHFGTEKALHEFFINEQGSFEIAAGHLVSHVQMFDGSSDVYLTTDDFFIIKYESDQIELFIIIIPSYQFRSPRQALLIISEILQVFHTSRFQTFLNLLDFLHGSCFRLRRKM